MTSIGVVTMKKKLPRHFQRVQTTGKLRICIKVPTDARDRLPEPERGKSYLIHHLHTSDLRDAEQRERELGVIYGFTRMIEQAKPKPTRWSYLPPTPAEIERMRIMIKGFLSTDPKGMTEQGEQLWKSLKSGASIPVLEGHFEEVPVEPHDNVRKSGGYLSFDTGTNLWADEKNVPLQTRDGYKSSMEGLAKHVGHDNANAVTRPDLIGWKDALVGSVLASKSIKNRLGHVKTVFKYLAENDKIDKDPNPVEKPVRYKHVRNPRTARKDFEPEDRAAIYRCALAETRPLYRWANLIMLFSGMRPEEFAEADTRDIRSVDDVWCLLLDYDFRQPAHDLKNDDAIRKVPLHSAILKAGFLEYVNSLPPGPLFPSLKANRYGKLAPDASRKLGSWLRETAEITNPRKVNYSHRHTVITVLCDLGVRETAAKRIAGHKVSGNIHEDYIHRSVAALKKVVEKIPVPV